VTVPVQNLTSTDAFVVVDIPDVPAAGVVRCARKILVSSASDLARTATYTYASFGHRISGASAGINAEGDAVPTAIAAFVTEMEPVSASGALLLTAGKGVTEADLAPLVAAATQSTPTVDSEGSHVAGVVAATRWALEGRLDGRRVAIEGEAPSALAPALEAAGAEVVTIEGIEAKPWLIWGAAVDAILPGSKMGVLSHQGAPMVKAGAIVPWGAIPVTTKAFAVLRRAGVTVVPDFVSSAGMLLAGFDGGDESSIAGQIVAVLDESALDRDGVLIGACRRAEAKLAEWSDVKLFGRPLAS
jgi:glutamate dehydrogenase/leucine dehydrogenase